MQQGKVKEKVVQSGRCTSTDGMLELDNLSLELQRHGNKNYVVNGHNSSSSSMDHEDVSDDDDGDDDDGDGISSSYVSNTACARNYQEGSTSNITYFLGQAFYPNTDQLAMQAFQKSLYWLTYRSDLAVPLRPYSNSSPLTALKHPQLIGEHMAVTGCGAGMKSDAGWGCMLRSAQMMLAQAVRRHYNPSTGCNSRQLLNKCDRKWTSFKNRDDPLEAERIAQWFADFPNHADDDIVDYDYNFRCRFNHSSPNEKMKEYTNSSEIDYPDFEGYGTGGINYHWYSLHQMVAAGIGLGILPGEWYGPTTACHVLRELNEIHCEWREMLVKKMLPRMADGTSDDFKPEEAQRYGQNSSKPETANVYSKNISPCDMFRVHVSTEGCIFVDAITKLMTQSKSGGDGGNCTEVSNINNPSFSQMDEVDDPLRQSLTKGQCQQGMTHDRSLESMHDIVEWDTSLLLLLPLRLGIQNISTSDYGSTLAKLIAFPHSVGMLGGTPRHALWFYGADAIHSPSEVLSNSSAKVVDGDQDCFDGGWYGLDPHTVQLAPRGTRVLVEHTARCGNNKIDDIDDTSRAPHQWQVQITDTYLRSLHISPTTSHPNNHRSIPLSKLDPSCALGFYIRDHADFVYFQHLIHSLSVEHCRPNKLPEIITVLAKTPNYEMNVSSAIKDMIGGEDVVKDETSNVEDLDGFSIKSKQEDDSDDGDDDDDFVLV